MDGEWGIILFVCGGWRWDDVLGNKVKNKQGEWYMNSYTVYIIICCGVQMCNEYKKISRQKIS